MVKNITEKLILAHRDLEWYAQHLEEFKTKFNNQFVAFQHQTVMDADPAMEQLLARLRNKGIDPAETIIRFVSKIKTVL